MRPSTRKALLWRAVGALCYLVGLCLALWVAVSAYLAPPANSVANLSGEHLPGLLVGVALIVVGRTIGWKLGGGAIGSGAPGDPTGRPGADQSALQQMGYRVPREDENGGYAYEDGDLAAVCNECGARNDPSFSYCRDCSSELPD